MYFDCGKGHTFLNICILNQCPGIKSVFLKLALPLSDQAKTFQCIFKNYIFSVCFSELHHVIGEDYLVNCVHSTCYAGKITF